MTAVLAQRPSDQAATPLTTDIAGNIPCTKNRARFERRVRQRIPRGEQG